MVSLVVLMCILILQGSIHEFKTVTVRRFSYEANPDIMKINISASFKTDEFTASADQWVFVDIKNINVN